MLYSRSLEDDKFAFFANFLERILDGRLEYVPFVQAIIKDASDLVTGIKNYYTIDRENYPLIIFLAQENYHFIQNLNLDNITSQDYQCILDMISKQRDIVFA